MKLLIKLNVYTLAVLLLTSCLKNKNDLGGMRDDSGSIVSTIAEVDYHEQDNHVIGLDYYATANFDFSGPNESVKFFTIHISQNRDTKMSGPITFNVTMTSIGATPLPAGAITVAPIQSPSSTANNLDFPVKFAVNKALLNPAGSYAANFTVTSASQGAVSSLTSSIDVDLFNSRYYGRYIAETTVSDPLNVLKMDKNIKNVLLDDPGAWGAFNASLVNPRNLSFVDEYHLALAGGTNGYFTTVNNLTTGTSGAIYPLLAPTFHLDANDNLIRVSQSTTGANLNVTLNGDAPNKFVYTSNEDRTFQVSYNVTLNLPGPGGANQSRTFKVQEKYTYHPLQMRVF